MNQAPKTAKEPKTKNKVQIPDLKPKKDPESLKKGESDREWRLVTYFWPEPQFPRNLAPDFGQYTSEQVQPR